ncbi:MAG: hypothetical protein JW862_12315 [Anaerolineales bacterium]|nr:hypothetical protein [Anaerolineales bacterium]
MDELTTIILIGVVGLLLGFVMGLLAGGGSSKETSSPEKDVDENWMEVARFWWDRRDSSLVLRAGERTYLQGAQVKPAESKRLQRMLSELYKWLTGEEMPAPDAGLERLSSLGGEAAAAEQRRRNLLLTPVDTFVRALDADVPKNPTRGQSIAAQIDAVLQEKLAASALKDKAIRLMEFPNKGMVVLIGLDQYEGIEAVPDENIRTLLRVAVAEWEARVAAEEED